MFPLLARRLQQAATTALPRCRRLGQAVTGAAAKGPGLAPAPAPAGAEAGASSRRALATFAGGRPPKPSSSPSSSAAAGAAGPLQKQQLDASSGSAGSVIPLGVPHFEIRVYDMEEALEALTRQQAVPLGYALPVDRPAPSIDAPPPPAPVAAATATAVDMPRIAPATSTAITTSFVEEEAAGSLTSMEGVDDEAGGPLQQQQHHCIKRTYQPSVLRRKRAHGFLSRLKNRDGRKILARRRLKHRSRMGV